MKKINLCSVLVFVFIFFTAGTVFAASKISEEIAIKVVIDGTQCTYSTPPISVNDRTMLPLTEMLNNLGVKKSNIKWNSKDQSITITKDSTKLYLKVNSNKAFINKKSTKLDAAPVIYKNKTYIPVSFVSQSLGKKVVWDGKTGTIVICSEDSYNQVKDILAKSDAIMKKYKSVSKVTMNMGDKVKSVSEFTRENDDIKNIEHSVEKQETNGDNKQTETYTLADNEYSRTDSDKEWKLESPEDEEEDEGNSIDKPEPAYIAGLKVANSDNKDDLILDGDVGLTDFFDDTNNDGTYKINTRIVLDKNTYVAKEVRFIGSGTTIIDDSFVPYTVTADISFTKLDDSYEITIPDEIKSLEKGLLTLKTDDSNAKIKVPMDWSELDKTDDAAADIFAGKQKDDTYVMVICDDKIDMSDDMKLSDYTKFVNGQIINNIVAPEIGETSNLTINGMNAMQYELSGELDKFKIKYLITVVESKAKFYRIYTWSLQSSFEKNKDTFKGIANSLEEIHNNPKEAADSSVAL